MNRNTNLDIIKILACFCVVVLHTIGNDVGIVNSIIYYLAGCAVPLFFAVNGFLIMKKETITYKYILKKILCILKVVFSWNIVLFFLYLLKSNITNPFRESIRNLLQIGVLDHFWFLGSLIIIYIFLPVVKKIFNSRKKIFILTLIFIIICISIDIFSFIRCLNGYNVFQSNIIQTFRFWNSFAYFLLGGILSDKEIMERILSKISIKLNVIILIVMTIVVVFYQYIVSRNVYNLFQAEYFYDNIFTFIWIISIFIFIYRQKLPKLKHKKILDIIVKNMMGIYIIHIPIIKLIIFKFYDFSEPIINILIVPILFFSSLLISHFISKIPLLKKIIQL